MLEEAQHTKALLGMERVCALLSFELGRALSGKFLGNESRRGLGIASILFTIHHRFKSSLDP
jgi:hypothetical protein